MKQSAKGRADEHKREVPMKVMVRPARTEDRKPLMAFISHVWGGHDYIPRVWDQWLHARRGKMFVVELGGAPVGMNRVRFLEDGCAWFEGARVHPDFRGRGLAAMLGESSMKFAVAEGAHVFRLTSGSHNKAAHRQISKMRFREVSRFSVYEPRGSTKPEPIGTPKKMVPGELRTALSILRRTREFRLGCGVFWHDFAAATLSRDVMSLLLAEGAVWQDGDAVAVTRSGGGGEGNWEEICFLGGPVKNSMKLVRALVGRDAKATERFVFVPQGSPIISVLRGEGYVRNFSMVLFERKATKG